MLQVSNIYALRMAGVLLISLGTMWLRTRVMPRWLALVTYVVAIVLLVVTSVSLWVTLIFPAWVLGVSILILFMNFDARRPTTNDDIVRSGSCLPRTSGLVPEPTVVGVIGNHVSRERGLFRGGELKSSTFS